MTREQFRQVRSLLARGTSHSEADEARLSLHLTGGKTCTGVITQYGDLLEVYVDGLPPAWVDLAAVEVVELVA